MPTRRGLMSPSPPLHHGRRRARDANAPENLLKAWPRQVVTTAAPGSGSARPSGAEHPAGERPGVLAVVQHDLAADDDVLDALRALHPPRRAVRPVVGDLVLSHADAREIEDHEVRRQPLAHQAAIVQTHDAGGLERVPADGVLEAQEPTLADPLPEDIARLAGGGVSPVPSRPRI